MTGHNNMAHPQKPIIHYRNGAYAKWGETHLGLSTVYKGEFSTSYR